MKLIVTKSFGKYSVGDVITDSNEINQIINSEQYIYVVSVQDTKE